MFFWIVKAIKKFKSSYPRTDLFLRRSLYLGDIFIKNLSDEKLELSEAVTCFFCQFHSQGSLFSSLEKDVSWRRREDPGSEVAFCLRDLKNIKSPQRDSYAGKTETIA